MRLKKDKLLKLMEDDGELEEGIRSQFMLFQYYKNFEIE